MSTDGSDWQGEGSQEFEEPVADRPYGARPYGARPYGARPYGARPYGARPYGARPYGARPYGARPYEGGPAGQLDPAEWGEEVCELVLARSAVVRLGATVVSSDADLAIPAATPAVDFRGPGVAPAAAPGAAEVKQLSPREWRLEAWISIPNRVFRSLEANPELAQTLKADLAEALARRADEAFLGGLPPRDVAARAAARAGCARHAGSLLETARDVVSEVRAAEAEFHSPGWILHPSTLDALTSSTTTNGLVHEGAQPRSLDSLRLLTLDGVDGGALLGYPFATSTAAGERLFFAADWRQAYVCVAETPVTVDTPVAPAVPEAVVIRASMTFDFALRRNDGFATADRS